MNESNCRIISIVGAGGKTTLIHKLRDEYLQNGKRVLVATTTHMYKEPGTICVPNHPDPRFANEIIQKLNTDRYCMAGTEDPVQAMKLCALPSDLLDALIPFADIILIEADGAKHYDAKFPRAGEPVILPQTDEIIVVMGLNSIGKKASDSIFGFEQMQEILPVSKDQKVTFELLQSIVDLGYKNKLKYMNTNRSNDILCRALYSVKHNAFDNAYDPKLQPGLMFLNEAEAGEYVREHYER